MNSRPREAQGEFFGGHLRAGVEAVGDGPARQADQALAVGVVHIDDARARGARAGAFEQAALGGEVLLEGLVKIEMVAREIGEDGGGEPATPQAIQRQRVRTGFQHGVRAAGVNDLGEKALQVQRFRRGGGGRTRCSRRAIDDGAEEAALVAGGAHDRIDQEARGGLAVGAGDADQLQASPRDGRKNWRRSMASALRASVAREPQRIASARRAVAPVSKTARPMPAWRRRHFADDRARAARDGVGDKPIAIGDFAVDGHEQRAGEAWRLL